MKKAFLSFLGFACCMGCRKEPSPFDKIAYYRFSPAELARLPAYRAGDSLVFEALQGEKLVLNIDKADSFFKKRYGAGMGFSSPHAAYYFFYDAVRYKFSSPTDQIFGEFYFQKWPIDQQAAESNIERLFPARAHGQIYLPAWSGPELYLIIPDSPDTSLRINGLLYPDVVKFKTDSSDTSSPFKRISALYYAYKNGIVGFDEKSGKQWRLQR